MKKKLKKIFTCFLWIICISIYIALFYFYFIKTYTIGELTAYDEPITKLSLQRRETRLSDDTYVKVYSDTEKINYYLKKFSLYKIKFKLFDASDDLVTHIFHFNDAKLNDNKEFIGWDLLKIQGDQYITFETKYGLTYTFKILNYKFTEEDVID